RTANGFHSRSRSCSLRSSALGTSNRMSSDRDDGVTIARKRTAAHGVASTIAAGWRDVRRAWNARAWASVVVFAVIAAVPAIVSDPVSLSRLASGLYIALAAVGLD